MPRLQTVLILLIISSLPLLMTGCGGSVSANAKSSVAVMTAELPLGVVGNTYSVTLQAMGGVLPYTWSVVAGQLPVGLTLTGATISGTPQQPGTSTFTLQVKDASGQPASVSLQLVVDGPLNIVTSAVPDGTLGQPYSTQLAASGGIPPYTWQIVSGALPAGLILSSSGLLSGTPSAQADTTVDIQVNDSAATQTAANGGGSSGSNSKSKGIKVRTYKPLAITTASMPPATVGSAYSQTLQATGGLTPYVWSITSGQLPPGLAFNAGTGTISGTPSASGQFNFTAGVSDSASPASSAAAPLTLAANGTASQLTVLTTSLPSATAGVSYTATLQASGGTPPYAWLVASGALPSGLTLDASTGVISGTATISGSFNIGVQVKDSASTPASATQGLTVVVAQAEVMVTISPASVSLPTGGTQQFAVAVSGTTNTALTWAVNGFAGGTATLGTISTTGLYTAPASVPSSSVLTVSATSAADTSKSATAAVTITASSAFDQYGGLMSSSCTGGSKSHFYTEVINGAWRFCTPDGHEFFYQAVYVVDSDSRQWGTLDAKYGNHDVTWGPQQNRRLKAWGFNALGPYANNWVLPTATYPSWPGDHSQPVKVPWVAQLRATYYSECNMFGYASDAVKDLVFGSDSHYKNYRGGGFPDIYDPKYATYLGAILAAQSTAWDSPWIIGINIDDTDELQGFGCGPDWGGCGGGTVNPHLGWVALITAPSQTGNPSSCDNRGEAAFSDTKVYTKYALRDFLTTKYTTIAALNAAWGANYTTWDSAGGWGIGTGLLDENGRNPWICADDGSLSGCAAAMKTDLDNFQYEIARQYFTSIRGSLKTRFPGILYFGPSAIGTWGYPAYRNVLRGAQGNVDVLATRWLGDQAQLDFDAQYAGNLPIISWLGETANPDSDMYAYPHFGDFPTQQQRAQKIYNDIANALSAVAATSGVKPYAGFQFWQLYDNISESANWGLISLKDNPYDGISAVTTVGTDQWGYLTGGEARNYGDFLSIIRQATALWTH